MLLDINAIEKKYNNAMIENILTTFNYVPTWQHLINIVDSTLRLHYGSRELLEYYKNVDEKEVQADFEVLLYAYLKSKEIEYKKLYAISIADYEPLENYRMEEHETITDTKDNMYGKKSISEEIDFGEQRVHEEVLKGQEISSTSVNYGEINTNASGVNDRAPFDSESYSRDRKTADNSTTDEHTDITNVTVEERADEVTNITDAHLTNKTSDISDYSDTLHTDNERNLTRFGNIGVTTSQQMAESEIELALKLNVAERIAHDIANVISKGVYVAL